MLKDGSLLRLSEMWSGQRYTRLAMLIDPPKQSPLVAQTRTAKFLQQGGNAVLIGGSGHIEEGVFQETVDSVVDASVDVPIIIFPGHINQIPRRPDGITGVLNYSFIVGSEGYDFDVVYPPQARQYVHSTLSERGIPSISTLYVLCGDPNASVSRVTGIKPVDTGNVEEQERVLHSVQQWLQRGVDCVFFDAGSHASTSANPDMVRTARELIDEVSPDTLLFIGGGVYQPDNATPYKGVVDCISVGSYFEENGAVNVDQFLTAIRS